MNKYDIAFLELLKNVNKTKKGVQICPDLLSEDMRKILGFKESINSVIFTGIYVEKVLTMNVITAPEWMKNYES